MSSPSNEDICLQNQDRQCVRLSQHHWHCINDTVMGGCSQSLVSSQGNHLLFSGDVSLKNNGGFASIRHQLNFRPINKTFISITVKGDGQTYQLRLRSAACASASAYKVNFVAVASQWQTYTFSQTEFIATHKGQVIPHAPALAFDEVEQLGFLISAKQQGPFALEISSICFHT